jgi:hypothetical protein
MAISARELFTTWGFDIDDTPIRNLDKSVDKLKNTLKVIGIAAVASAGALFGVAKSVADFGDKTAKTADKLGVGIEALQELRFAADRAGVTMSSFDVGLQRFVRRAAEAAQGTGVAKDTLKELGVQLLDSTGKMRPVEDLLGDVADGFKKIPSQSDRVRQAFKLFDTEGVALVNLLQQGSGALEQFRNEARMTGSILGEDTARASEEFQDRLKDVTSVIAGIRNEVGAKLIPVITDLMIRFRDFVILNRALIKERLDKFMSGLISILKTLTIVAKNVWIIVNRIVSIFGGWERTLKLVIKSLGVFLALNLLSSIGGIALALGRMAVAWATTGRAALIAQAKMAAIPLLIGAGIVALVLIIEDLIGFFQGKDSLTGRILEGFEKRFPVVFKWIKAFWNAWFGFIPRWMNMFNAMIEMFKRFGEVVMSILSPIFALFKKSFKVAADVAVKPVEGLINFSKNILPGGETVDFARRFLPETPIPSPTPATAPAGSNLGGVNNTSLTVSPKIDIAVNGAGDPKEVGVAVATEVKNVINGMIRQTNRDFPDAIEE